MGCPCLDAVQILVAEAKLVSWLLQQQHYWETVNPSSRPLQSSSVGLGSRQSMLDVGLCHFTLLEDDQTSRETDIMLRLMHLEF